LADAEMYYFFEAEKIIPSVTVCGCHGKNLSWFSVLDFNVTADIGRDLLEIFENITVV